MAALTLQSVSKVYPGGHSAVRDVSLEVADGELLALVGPSGCGKSTLLRLIAGLETPTSGRLLIDEQDVSETQPQSRDLAMVFQSYALYPHMTVYDNLAYSLRVRGASREEIKARVTSTAKTLDLDSLLDRRPGQLSGGQRQRVALGRAIVREPKAFLFDEPLSNLDPALRGQARAELLALRTRLRATMIYVTHDQEEAMTLGTRVAVMREGRIVQVDAPLNVYNRPANTFVATFIGSPPMNLLPASILAVENAPRRLVGIRPQDVIVGREGLPAHVEVVEIRGPDAVVHLRLPGLDSARVVAVVTGTPPDPGTAIGLTWDPKRLLTFEPDGERCAQS